MINSNLTTQEDMLQRRLLARSKSRSRSKTDTPKSPLKAYLNLNWTLRTRPVTLSQILTSSQWYFFNQLHLKQSSHTFSCQKPSICKHSLVSVSHFMLCYEQNTNKIKIIWVFEFHKSIIYHSGVKWDSFWGSFVGSVVQVKVDAFVSVFALSVLSGFDSVLGLVDFGLGDVNVSVIDPHWVRSQLIGRTVAPCLSWNVGYGSSLVVFCDFHGSSVLLVVQSFESGVWETFAFQTVKGPVGANADDVVLLFETLVFIIAIGNETSLVSRDGSETESWQLNGWETQFVSSVGSLLDSIVIGSSGISEGVVVRRPVLIEINGIGVGLFISQRNTSGKYHLEPCLAPTAILSLVDTCWTAKGFIDATALLIESENVNDSNTGIWGESSLLVVYVWVKGFVDFDRWVNFHCWFGWGSFLGWHFIKLI